MDVRLHLAQKIAFAGRRSQDRSADAEAYWNNTLKWERGTYLKQADGVIEAILAMMPKLTWNEVDDDHFAATCPFTRMGFECRQGIRGPVRFRTSLKGDWLDLEGFTLGQAKKFLEKFHQNQLLEAVGLSDEPPNGVDPADDLSAGAEAS